MIPGLLGQVPLRLPKPDEDPHVLVVATNPRVRYALANLLLDAGLRVTTAATYGVVEILLEGDGEFELMVAAQSAGEMAQFGTPQLARSVQPGLPILVLDFVSLGGAGLIDAVRDTLQRWPTRDRAARLHH